jgi:translocation and assembly module TamA
MNLRRAAAALRASARAMLLPMLLPWILGGCASLSTALSPAAKATTASTAQTTQAAPTGPTAPTAPTVAAIPGTPDASASPATSTVAIEVDAPDRLRALLESHLDLVRLGRAAPADVDDSEWARLIDATPAQVRELLQTEGYFAPEVMLDRSASADGARTERVRLRVNPGDQAVIDRVTLEVEGELDLGASASEPHAVATLAALRQRFDMRPGSGFRNDSWSSAKAAALSVLRAAGYAHAAFSGTTADVDVAANRVRLFLVIDSGPLYRLGTLDIEGLVEHDVQTVRNLALTRSGVPVTETLLLDFQDRLQKAGLFDSISVTLDADAAQPAQARVRVRLRESPLQVYTVGLGFSANTGYRASVEHLYRRVFGFAATARNKAEWGDKRQAWEGEIMGHPGRRLYRNLVGGAIERLQTDTDTVLSQRLRIGRTQDTQRLERLFFLEAERSVRKPAGGEDASAFAISGNFHGAWRHLDNIVLPTRGATLKVELGLGRAHGDQSKSGVFTRTYGRLTGYLPLGDAWYGQARIELGQVFLPDGVVVPDSKLFRAGGDESVRGYTFRSLGPLVDGAVGGGLSLATASVELARPISARLPSVWGAIFLDAGNAADSFSRLKPVYGAGIGVRWRSPVGPLRLDWAYGTQTRQGRFHFSVGIAF